MIIPNKHQLPNHAFEDKRFAYSRFEIAADGTGKAFLKLSNGKKLSGQFKAGVVIGFFDSAGSEKLRVVLTAEVSDLAPGASTKEKDVSTAFSLSPEDWASVDRTGHSYFLNYKPEDFGGVSTGMWTVFTW